MARLLRWFLHAMQQLGGILFLLLFLDFIVQIVARFLFNQPLPWSDELAVVLYVWIILWGCTFMVPQQEHVVFDLLWNSASPLFKKIMQVTGHALLGTLAFIAIPASWDYIHFMGREATPVLEIPFEWVFFPFLLLLLSIGLRSVGAIWQVFTQGQMDGSERVSS